MARSMRMIRRWAMNRQSCQSLTSSTRRIPFLVSSMDDLQRQKMMVETDLPCSLSLQFAVGTCTGPSSLCGSAGYAMESECHAGQVVLYNTTGLLGWSTNIATHRIATMTDDLLSSDWGERVRKEYKAKKKGSMFKRSRWPWRGSHDNKDDEEWLDKIGEVPAVTNQNDCVDCESWKFVEDDKWK